MATSTSRSHRSKDVNAGASQYNQDSSDVTDWDAANGSSSCTDKFYLVTKADQTVSVFKDIGTSLSKLRVAR